MSSSAPASAPAPLPAEVPNAHRLDLSAEEWFDVLTPGGSQTGQRKLRRLVHADGDWHASVHIWLLHSGDGRVLVQKRASTKDSFPSCWDVSCAGHISAGESVAAGAIAELQEELGITPPASEQPDPFARFLRLLCVMPREVISQAGRFIDREHTSVFLCEGSWAAESLVLQAEEVDAVEWMELEQIVQAVRTGERGWVAIPDMEAYEKAVFEPIRERIKQIRKKTQETSSSSSSSMDGKSA